MRTLKQMHLTTTAVLAALLAAPAAAAPGDWDANADGSVSETEFTDEFSRTGVFEDWDTDGDGALTEGEFSTGAYRGHDADRDGAWNDAEWDMAETEWSNDGFWYSDGYRYGYDTNNVYDRGAWDPDGDGTVLLNEFSDGFAQAGVVDEWDTDGDAALSSEEFATGVFDRYDGNRDGMIDDSELLNVDEDMGEDGFWSS